MQSFILCGGNKVEREHYIAELTSAKTELIHILTEKSSITIKQIQDLNIPLSIAARIPRLVWIEEANLMTVPAQNALLKMLEEPPTDTQFYLTCQSAVSLLPTIRSRAKTIKIDTLNSASNPSVLKDLKQVMAMKPGDRLLTITKRDRSESILWIANIEREIKNKIKDPTLNPKSLTILAKIAKLAQETSLQLVSNCSVSLSTQNFYLLLPHTTSQT
ncbi:MAG: hypothetical protein WAV40_02630 [Microgenomates group bacterium]